MLSNHYVLRSRSGVGYQCLGNVSEWTKCQEKTTEPARKEFKLPDVSAAMHMVELSSGILTEPLCSISERVMTFASCTSSSPDR